METGVVAEREDVVSFSTRTTWVLEDRVGGSRPRTGTGGGSPRREGGRHSDTGEVRQVKLRKSALEYTTLHRTRDLEEDVRVRRQGKW